MILGSKQTQFIDLVKSGIKHILVEAPAGTGKTFSCIQAVKAISDAKRIEPYQKVLVLTFSRNARAQLIKELSLFPIDDPVYKHIDINNYHSFFKRYLDTYRDTIGITMPLRVLDDEDFLVEMTSFSQTIGARISDKLPVSILDDFIIQGETVTPVNDSSKINSKHYKDVKTFLDVAFLLTQATGFVCFAQFGSLINRILVRNRDLPSAISHDFPILILDEYQDTNFFQEIFVRSLSKKSSCIFFCDRYQMIYAFRGSTLRRITDLRLLYPDLETIEFDEYYRYKDRPDLVKLLTCIRSGGKPDYSGLTNGKQITASANCNSNWRMVKGVSLKKQCTLFCNTIFYCTRRKVGELLRKKKSICILCRTNDEVDRLVCAFQENGYHPKEFSDTKDMLALAKHMKSLIEERTIKENISHLLSVVLLCTSQKKLFGESISVISQMDYEVFRRKTKPGFKRLKTILSAKENSCGYFASVKLIEILINEIKEDNTRINWSQYNFFAQCAKLLAPSPEVIDGVMLQRQYINSFSNISPGLYISTIHQAKGKEFDCVFVVDALSIQEDKNLLYVSHSRMKECLFPVVVSYNGFTYNNSH